MIIILTLLNRSMPRQIRPCFTVSKFTKKCCSLHSKIFAANYKVYNKKVLVRILRRIQRKNLIVFVKQASPRKAVQLIGQACFLWFSPVFIIGLYLRISITQCLIKRFDIYTFNVKFDVTISGVYFDFFLWYCNFSHSKQMIGVVYWIHRT